MRRLRLLTISLVVAAALALPVAAHADEHFVEATATRSGDALTVDFKLAGLGNTDQTITLVADVACFNRGGQHPKAENKQAVIASGVFSPDNGHIDGTLTGVGTTDPDCAPPMELRYANVSLSAEPAGVSVTLDGTF